VDDVKVDDNDREDEEDVVELADTGVPTMETALTPPIAAVGTMELAFIGETCEGVMT